MKNHTYTRRTVIENLLRASACAAISAPTLKALAQYGSGDSYLQRGGVGQYTREFEQQYHVPAMSVAVSKGGQFVFDRAGGMGDRQHMVQAEQDTIFRIADVSKPITAVAIFSLIQTGKLKLNDTIFGPEGILDAKYGKAPYRQYVTDVTVDHLLTHTAGGWSADDNDPMYHNDGWDQAKLITSTIANLPLTSRPGTQWAYSNFGYCVLGRVIEQVTNQPYDVFVQAKILAPCGISGMQIGRNSQRDRASNEVVYVGQYSENPYKVNVTRMDSTAGWLASSTQLVQFLNHVAGAPGIPALLNPETIRTMTAPASAAPPGKVRCARGWMVTNDGCWFHSGSLPGSTSLVVRNSDGSCSAAICNTRTQPHGEMDDALYQTMRDLTQAVA